MPAAMHKVKNVSMLLYRPFMFTNISCASIIDEAA